MAPALTALTAAASGDFNGDGMGDLVIGADSADPNGNLSGSSFVVFGRDAVPIFKDDFE
jgi:hypothetical protein